MFIIYKNKILQYFFQFNILHNFTLKFKTLQYTAQYRQKERSCESKKLLNTEIKCNKWISLVLILSGISTWLIKSMKLISVEI